jgi:hypothetical protein
MNLVQRNVVLGALAAVLAIPTILQLRRDAETFVDVGRVPLLFDGFNADNVMLITLGQPKKDQPAPEANQPPRVVYDQLVLQRSDKGWVLAAVQGQDLAGAPVNKDRVESDVFAHLRAIRIDRDALVQPSASPEQLEKFGLDDAHAFVIVASDNTPQHNVIADVLVGRDASQGQTGTEAVRGVYVRKRDSTDVVLYEFDKGWRRDVQQDQWLDKVIAKLEPDKIQKLRIQNTATPKPGITFVRKDGKASWSVVEPPPGLGAVRQTEVENVAQRLRWIAAQDFKMPTTKANLGALGLVPAKIEIDLDVKDGDRVREIKLAVGNQVEGKNEFYLLCNEVPFVLTWPAGTVTTFEADIKAQLFDPAPPPPDKPGEGDKKDETKKDEGKK